MGEEHRYIVDVRFLNGIKSPLDKEAYFDIKSNEYEITSLCIEWLHPKN